MHLTYYEYKMFNNVVYDELRKFCLYELINEDYMRSLIKKANYFRNDNDLARRVKMRLHPKARS